MLINMVGAFIRNAPFGTEIAFKSGFEAMGIDTVCVDPGFSETLDELDRAADATIIFKTGQGKEQFLSKGGGIRMVYQPDDMRFPHIVQMAIDMKNYCDIFLSYDQYCAQLAKNIGYRSAYFLPLTADPTVYYPDDCDRDIDVTFVGSLGGQISHASRLHMVRIADKYCKDHGLKTFFAQDLYNIPQLRSIYCRSKVVLNHATDVGQKFGTGFGLQCRHFEVGLTRTALLSNKLLSGDIGLSLPECTFHDEESLLQKLDALLGDAALREATATTTYNKILRDHLPIARARWICDLIRNSIA